MEKYEIIYDYENEKNIVEEFICQNWNELKEYVKKMRKTGCYNISASLISG